MEGDTISKMIDYEQGMLSAEDTVIMFQALIDNGMAWRLQGSYGRMATTLINNGYCHTKEDK